MHQCEMGIGYMGYMGFREKLPSCILSIPFSSPVCNWQLGSFRLELEHNFRVLHAVMQPEDQEEVELHDPSTQSQLCRV